jgi:hypothetical protein
LAPVIPVDADRDQHRLADNHAGLAHPLVARIQDQIGEGFGQGTAGECRVGKLELRVPQDREGRFSTELFERYQRSERALVAALAEM